MIFWNSEPVFQGYATQRPFGNEIESIVDTAISSLVAQGCRNIIMPPIRTKDCENEENEKLIVEACKKWLEKK